MMNRKQAVKEAIASMEMSGFVFTEEELALFNRYAKGEISSDDIKKFADDRLKQLQIEHPEYFATEEESRILDMDEDKTFEYYMSLPYKMVIYPASEGGYVAEIPDLPGCLTQGDSWQDIFEMIQDAKAALIDIALQDGTKIPEPNKS